MKMRREESLLLVIDVQERLHAAMPEEPSLDRNLATLLEAARVLEVEVAISEQYPAGLGPTLPDLRQLAPAAPVFEKVEFSAFDNAGIRDHIVRVGRSHLILCGMETHICVAQTAMDALGAGFDVFVVADAVQSRHDRNRQLALQRLAALGAYIVSTEMVCFEWLGSAADPAFRPVSKLVR